MQRSGARSWRTLINITTDLFSPSTTGLSECLQNVGRGGSPGLVGPSSEDPRLGETFAAGLTRSCRPVALVAPRLQFQSSGYLSV